MNNFVKTLERYKDFVFLENPIPFDDLFSYIDYPVVQLHDITNYGTEEEPRICGFCGTCKWENGVLSPLDGDSYTKHMEVLGYHEFKLDGETCLDILVEDW